MVRDPHNGLLNAYRFPARPRRQVRANYGPHFVDISA